MGFFSFEWPPLRPVNSGSSDDPSVARRVIERLLAHPLTRGLDLDSPDTTALRRRIVMSKPFLRSIYAEWYDMISSRVPGGQGQVLELGSGGGFFGEVVDGLITSDVFEIPGVDEVIDARDLPFGDGDLKAIVMTNVLHHIPDVAEFLREAQRTLRPGGRIVMIEPWNTAWSRYVHRQFHDEPMIVDNPEWQFPESGPLSGANAALAWVIAVRDSERLEREWPGLRVSETSPFMPFRYIVSGGVSLRSLQPSWSYGFWKWLDKRKSFQGFSVFALVVLDRIENGHP